MWASILFLLFAIIGYISLAHEVYIAKFRSIFAQVIVIAILGLLGIRSIIDLYEVIQNAIW